MANEAIVIGINKYPSSPLQYAVSDAEEVGRCLGECNPPYRVNLLCDEGASRRNILHGIERLARSNSEVKLLYLAGHAGIYNSGPYFVPYGANDTTEMVSFSDIANRLGPALVQRKGLVCVILDCCHAGSFGLDNSFTLDDLHRAISKDVAKTNIACLLACTIGSSARELSDLGHGVFTYHLTNGLRGAAAAVDGSITPELLYHYTARLLELDGDQRPSYKADVVGRSILIEHVAELPSEATRQQRLKHAIQELRCVLEKAEEDIASRKPPFAPREEYRRSGWQQAAKLAQSTVELRRKVELQFGEDLNGAEGWEELNDDISAMLREFASGMNVGVVTELGRISSKIGEGGFGAVYRVTTETRDCALKVFNAHDVGNRTKTSLFRGGYQAMDRLAHPQIVKVIKFSSCPLSFYMDFIDGVNLRKWYSVTHTPLDLTSMLLDIVRVVEYAHGAGVVHRDIKPENVIVRYNSSRNMWEPVLTDFDLAWFSGRTQTVSAEGFGAPYYAAPEQITYPGRDVSHQQTVDVFSIAMLALFLYTGQDPIVLEESTSRLREVLLLWPSKSAGDRIADIVRRAGMRRYSDRIKSVAEIRIALMSVLAELRSASDPLQVVSVRDFWSVIGSVLSVEYVENLNSISFQSHSFRTRIDLNLDGSKLELAVSKTGPWLARNVATSVAREALRQRVDNVIQQWRRRYPEFVGLRRHAGSLAPADGRSVMSLAECPSTGHAGRAVGELLAELIVTYENF